MAEEKTAVALSESLSRFDSVCREDYTYVYINEPKQSKIFSISIVLIDLTVNERF
jgi:hypothetical protein